MQEVDQRKAIVMFIAVGCQYTDAFVVQNSGGKVRYL